MFHDLNRRSEVWGVGPGSTLSQANKQLWDSLNSAKRIGKRQHMFGNTCVKCEFEVKLPLLSVSEPCLWPTLAGGKPGEMVTYYTTVCRFSFFGSTKSLKNRDDYLRLSGHTHESIARVMIVPPLKHVIQNACTHSPIHSSS